MGVRGLNLLGAGCWVLVGKSWNWGACRWLFRAGRERPRTCEFAYVKRIVGRAWPTARQGSGAAFDGWLPISEGSIPFRWRAGERADGEGWSASGGRCVASRVRLWERLCMCSRMVAKWDT